MTGVIVLYEGGHLQAIELKINLRDSFVSFISD